MAGPGFGLDAFGTGPSGSAGDLLTLVNAFAITTNAVRVTLSTPPRQSSRTAVGDALNPATWNIADTNTGAVFTVMQVLPVGVSYVTFDVQVVEPFSFQEALEIYSTTLLAPNGDGLTPPVFFNFNGVGALAQQPAQLASTRNLAAKDIANPPAPTGGGSLAGTLVVTPAGDYATETGVALLKKLIIRRLTTPQGGFFHLPAYGVGLRVKELLPIADLVKLKAKIETQVLQEPEVQDASAVLSMANNALTLVLSVKMRATGARIDIPFTAPLAGTGPL
jgi:hypothetical protein